MPHMAACVALLHDFSFRTIRSTRRALPGSFLAVPRSCFCRPLEWFGSVRFRPGWRSLRGLRRPPGWFLVSVSCDLYIDGMMLSVKHYFQLFLLIFCNLDGRQLPVHIPVHAIRQ